MNSYSYRRAPMMRGGSRHAPHSVASDSEVSTAPLPWDGLLVSVAAFVLVGMARVHSVVPGMQALRPALLSLVFGVVFYLVSTTPTRSLRHLRHPISWISIFFLAWAALGAPFGLWPGHSIRFLTGDFLRLVIFFILLAACVRNLHDVRRMAMALAIGGMLFALLGALPAGYRAVESGGYDPNDSAMFLVITLPLILYFMTRERRPAFKLIFGAALIITLLAIIRTGSRGGFVALVALVLYTVFLFRGIKPVFRVGAVVVITGVMMFAATGEYWERMQSINDPTDYNLTDPAGRQAVWARARGYMADNPVLGVGITNFAVAEARHPMIRESIMRGIGFKYSAAHSIWYQVGVETGIPGLVAFVSLFAVCIVYLVRLGKYARAAPQSEYLQEAAGLGSALIGCLIAIMVAGSFLSNAYWAMVWGIFAMILGLLKVLRFQGIDAGRAPARAAVLPPGAVRSRGAAVPASAHLRASARHP